MFWPCETRTSICRNLATISSGLYRFLAITVLLDVKDIPQVGPLQWGWIMGACEKWRRNFKPGRPSKRTNTVWAITRWRASGVRFGVGLSRPHKFVGLCADHRIAFAGTVL